MFRFFPVMLFLVLIFSACSSAPRRPAENFAVRSIAANQLNMANQAANQGLYEDAMIFLLEARRLALSADDPKLRIETSMSRASILFSMGLTDEAFQEWEDAAAEGDSSGERELAALSRIYSIRAVLTLYENNSPGVRPDLEDLKTRINQEMAVLSRNSHPIAAAYITLGLAEKQQERWADAESAVTLALAIYERGHFLEDAAYAWFLIASIRSLAGNYDTSLEALRRSIEMDRRAENSFGLASSWQAMGEVQGKAGRPEESRAALLRAAGIYRAIGHDEKAEELEAQL